MPAKLQLSKKLIITTAVAITLLASLYYWYDKTYYPSTDNAYVQANTISMAAQVSGPVAQVNVQNYQFVKAGQILFSIDAQPFKLAVAKAQAQVDMLQKQAERTLALVQSKQLPKANGDDITAQLQMARAELGQTLLDLQHTQIIAPVSGQIVNFTVRPGTMVSTGMPLFALVDTSQWWVDANYKETDLKRIKPRQPATIKIDIYPGLTLHGSVAAVSGGSGAAFSLFPPENATGNWVKVTQRFPVKILIQHPDPNYPLRVGASSVVTINTL
jgi:membrane fusion protein (multidrug efflux system)